MSNCVVVEDVKRGEELAKPLVTSEADCIIRDLLSDTVRDAIEDLPTSETDATLDNVVKPVLFSEIPEGGELHFNGGIVKLNIRTQQSGDEWDVEREHDDVKQTIINLWDTMTNPGSLENTQPDYLPLAPTAKDSNTPRSCSFDEDDVRKVLKGLQDMKMRAQPSDELNSFVGQGDTVEEMETVYRRDILDDPSSHCTVVSDSWALQNQTLASNLCFEPSGGKKVHAVPSKGFLVPTESSVSSLGAACGPCDSSLDTTLSSIDRMNQDSYERDETSLALNKKHSVSSKEMTESVLQIINGPDESEECLASVTSDEITFKLMEHSNLDNDNEKEELPPTPPNSDTSLEEEPSGSFKSGLTCVGPLKNQDHDPLDICSDDIEMGAMIHIPSSREVTSSMLESLSWNSNTSPQNPGGQIITLINHDIASYTKIQKVLEVVSHRPGTDTDIFDELCRPKPDLRDIDSDRSSREFQDLPLVTLKITETEPTDQEACQVEEEVQNIQLVLSGSRLRETLPPAVDFSREECRNDNYNLSRFQVERVPEPPSHPHGGHRTLSRAMRNVSSQIRKHTKSLPREYTAAMENYHSTILKKSRSIMKNTTSLFRNLAHSKCDMSTSQFELDTPSTSSYYPSRTKCCRSQETLSSEIELRDNDMQLNRGNVPERGAAEEQQEDILSSLKCFTVREEEQGVEMKEEQEQESVEKLLIHSLSELQITPHTEGSNRKPNKNLTSRIRGLWKAAFSNKRN